MNGSSQRQRASDDGGAEFACETVRQHAEPADRYRLEVLDPEPTALHQSLELANGHEVQPTLDFRKALGTIALKVGPPADERSLREQQMRPRKHRKQMTAQRMIPRG